MSRESEEEEEEEDGEEYEDVEPEGSLSTDGRNSEISRGESVNWYYDNFGRQCKKERIAKVSNKKIDRNGRSIKYNLTFEKVEKFVSHETKEIIIPIQTSNKKPKDDTKDPTDVETNSQVSRSSSDDSKTYSQVYSEIYEESVARQKNADNICKLYVQNRLRMHYYTENWVNSLELSMDDRGTEASDYSDIKSQCVQQKEKEKPASNVPKSHNQPKRKVFQNQLNNSELVPDNQQKWKTDFISISLPNLQVEEMYSEEEFPTQPDQSESWISRIEPERLSSNESIKSYTDEYQVNKSQAEYFQKSDQISSKNHSKFCVENENNAEEVSSSRDEQSCIENEDNMVDEYKEIKVEESESWRRKNKWETDSKNIQKIHNSVSSSVQSELSSIDYCQFVDRIEKPNCAVKGRESWRSKISYRSESSFEKQIILDPGDFEDLTDESGVETSQKSLEHVSSGDIETTDKDDSVKSFKKIRYKNNESAVDCNSYKSETYSSNHDEDYKPLDNLQISKQSSYRKNRDVRIDETISSQASAYHKEDQRFRQRIISERESNKRYISNSIRTCLVTPRSKGSEHHEYETDSATNLNGDRLPIRSRRSRRSRITAPKTYRDHACSPIRIINKEQHREDDEVAAEVPQSACSSKFDLKNEFSQASISSVDKSIQYPSDDELGNDKTHKFASETDMEVLEIPPTPVTLWSDSKKNISSPNSSNNSYRSSIVSISSYEPSVRFFRRTHAEDDDELPALPIDRNDSDPISYREHVALLAERALRACTNYYDEPLETSNAKVQLRYDPEKHYAALQSQRQYDDIL